MTCSIERLAGQIAAAEARLDLLEDMIDTTRRVVSAQDFKVETGTPTPQIITASEGALILGSEGSWSIVGEPLLVEVSHTGDVLETELYKITMPADTMGAKGFIRIFASWRALGTNTHAFKIYFGGSLIAQYTSVLNNHMMDMAHKYIWNREATNSQGGTIKWMNAHARNSEPAISLAIDTTAAVDITFTVQNAVAGETSFLRFALIEAHKREA